MIFVSSSTICLKWSRVGALLSSALSAPCFDENSDELAMKWSYREQCEYSVFNMAYWTLGKLSARLQLHGVNLSLNNSNKVGDSAYMQMRLFLALPNSANMHRSNTKLVSAFLTLLRPTRSLPATSSATTDCVGGSVLDTHCSDKLELLVLLSRTPRLISASSRMALYTSCTIGIDLITISVLKMASASWISRGLCENW